ncbi:hypothetical protein GCM10009775_32880 [Microbacterium aoyamense]|uniref:Uncharacterized protein n=1 Tax=Microbacterium aoyamense TaxID=344166 RepID=A0ABP5B9V8_9MICO|nr:hypothetical protein [Microbacterium aoyamense]
MSIFRQPIPTIVDGRHPLPELWIPDEESERASALRKQFKKTFKATGNDHATWREFVGIRLPAHVHEYFAAFPALSAAESDDSQRVLDPFAATTSVIRQNGSPMPTQLFVTRAAVDQAHPAATPQPTALVQEITSDGDRSWDAYLTLRAVDDARAEARAAAEAARQEQHMRATLMCPVCEQVPDSAGQTVRARLLVPVQGAAHVPSIRSCVPCWAVASAQYVAELASAPLAAGKSRTRGQAVAEHLRRAQ